MRVGVLCALAAAAAAEDVSVECGKMRVKQLVKFLHDRGHSCNGCAEKADYVAMCETHKDDPLVEAPAPAEDAAGPAPPQESIEELMSKMKGIPGMENIKMFGADDLKNMNYEQMGKAFGGEPVTSQRCRQTRGQYKKRLVEFYNRFGLGDKVAGADAALNMKWKGREERMFDKKYDAEIKAHYAKEDSEGARRPTWMPASLGTRKTRYERTWPRARGRCAASWRRGVVPTIHTASPRVIRRSRAAAPAGRAG